MNMNFDTWAGQFLPEQNNITANSVFGGLMFETYGQDLDYVLSVANNEPSRVWTLVDGDGADAIVSGYHFVNRLGYFITTISAVGDVEVNA